MSGGARAGRDVRAPARKTFVIDAFPASAFRHLERDAIVPGLPAKTREAVRAMRDTGTRNHRKLRRRKQLATAPITGTVHALEI